MACAARGEGRSGRRLSSANRVARGDAMAGDAEPPDDAWRWSSTKVAERWMPCFRRYAITETSRAVARTQTGGGEWSLALCVPFLGWSGLLGRRRALSGALPFRGTGAVVVSWPLFLVTNSARVFRPREFLQRGTMTGRQGAVRLCLCMVIGCLQYNHEMTESALLL